MRWLDPRPRTVPLDADQPSDSLSARPSDPLPTAVPSLCGGYGLLPLHHNELIYPLFPQDAGSRLDGGPGCSSRLSKHCPLGWTSPGVARDRRWQRCLGRPGLRRWPVSKRMARRREGAALEHLSLTDEVVGPALAGVLVDDSDEGTVGPVDFRSLDVRDFGTIYEGLLEAGLSVSDADLVLDANGTLRPARGDEAPDIPAVIRTSTPRAGIARRPAPTSRRLLSWNTCWTARSTLSWMPTWNASDRRWRRRPGRPRARMLFDFPSR